jgi:DNA-binding transcriptional MerR regulator/methylmalonyl-CoA mutase cobalamin-binding subunit
MQTLRYPMKFVVQQTGLSPHVLRVWERRYGAVHPERSDSNRRLYDEKDLNRLDLLAKLTKAGHGIGQIATLPADELESMAATLPTTPAPPAPSASPELHADLMDQAWLHVVALEPGKLRTLLDEAVVSLGSTRVLEQLLVPLVSRIGAGWEAGELSAVEEHAASAVIKEVLFTGSRPFAESAGAPGLVVATPTGQLHELGAAMITSSARRLGWNVTYLGPSLPAEDITRAAVRADVIAVALSIVYPGDDPLLPDELRRLRRLLPDGMPVLIGGRAAPTYGVVIAQINATLLTDIAGFKAELGRLREGRALSAGSSTNG